MKRRLSSEQVCRQVVETAGAAIICLDSNYLVTAWNRAAERLYGWGRDDILGKDYVQLCLPEDVRGPVVQEIQHVLDGHTIEGFENRIRTRDGQERILLWNVTPLDDSSPGVPTLLAIGQDITQLKRAERELRQLKEGLERERDYLREEVRHTHAFGEIVGESEALREVVGQLQAVAITTASVLILGESGVGKELVARAIHDHSLRADKPLVKVNCASVPRELFESEFFGHAKGSFTGALRSREGRFELAHKGTLFLDEVGEIPAELQGKLLRVLQEGQFERIGENQTRTVDVRIIAATNRDLEREVEAGRFRRDLYFRLSVFPIEVPPLRERREDIVPLALHLLEGLARKLNLRPPSVSVPELGVLEAYDWPGNVRELQNVLERALILGRSSLGGSLPWGKVLPHGLHGECVAAAPASQPAVAPDRGVVTADQWRRMQCDNILAALRRSKGRISGEGGAAELLGMKPSTLTSQMRSLGIKKPG